MTRRYVTWFLLLALLLIPSWAVAAAQVPNVKPVSLMIEGKTVQPDVPPVIEKGRTLVPVRVIAEGLRANVHWDGKTRTATIKRNQQTLVLTLASTKAVLNGKQVKLDTPPTIRNQRMLLPIRFVGEALGVTVGWDSTTQTVIANEAVRIHINGRDAGTSIPFYKRADKLYAPIQSLAEQVGVQGYTVRDKDGAVTIDSRLTVPLPQLEAELGGRVTWDRQDNTVEIERLNQFTGLSQEEDGVLIDTTLPVTANAFTLQGPHRIVIDLPHTVMADTLTDKDHASVDDADEAPLADVDEEAEKSASGDADTSDRGEDAVQEDEQDELDEPAPLITRVRYSQYSSSPQSVRVVIELSQQSKYNLEYTNEGIAVKVTPVPRKTGFLVVVDAGHGGKDAGARGVTGYLEKDFNLSVAKRMVELLKQYPELQVAATRTSDVYITLQDRVKMANELDADLFISIHANSFKPDARGTETFYYNAGSADFARVVHRHLLAATQFPDRKVKTAPFYVIKNTKMPAVLTETGFLSHSYESAQLASPAFQEKVAQALVAAIREYYHSYH